jgi:hypothetical protein
VSTESEASLGGSDKVSTESEAEGDLLVGMSNLTRKIGMAHRKNGPGGRRLFLRLLKAQLEAQLCIQLGPSVGTLLSLLINNRGWLEVSCHQKAREEEA